MHRTENQDEGHKKESQKWNDWIKEILEDAEMVKQREETEFLGTLEGASSGVCPMHFSVYVHKGPYAMVSPTNLYSVIEDAEKRKSKPISKDRRNTHTQPQSVVIFIC